MKAKSATTKNFLLVLLSTLSLVTTEQTAVVAQQQEFPSSELDRRLSEIADRRHLPGFSVAIVSKDRVLFQKGYGLADISKKTLYSPQSLQNIGSVSKTFVGIALMQLVEEGKIKLDEDINKHLPFKVVNPNYPQDVITVRHLANHTSTLTDTKEYWENCYAVLDPVELKQPGLARYGLLKNNRRIPLGEYVRNIVSMDGVWYKKANFLKVKPGTTFRYSNLGADLAGYIVEQVSGESFENYTEKHILNPVGMSHSGWDIEKIDRARFVSQYLSNMKRLPRYTFVTVLPDGGLITSVEDLSKYLMEVIRGYQGESNLLRQASFREMMTPQSKPKEGTMGYATFWGGSDDSIGHSGGDPGTTTFMYFNPKTNLGFILFTNCTTDNKASDRDLTDARNTLWGYIFPPAPIQNPK
jgi:CubicO group peptidase (beta-lactamase class C family)